MRHRTRIRSVALEKPYAAIAISILAAAISGLSLVISYLTYLNETKTPILYARGIICDFDASPIKDNPDDILNDVLNYKVQSSARIELTNRGGGIASNINISIWPVLSASPIVDINPPIAYKVDSDENFLLINIPHLGPKEFVVVDIIDKGIRRAITIALPTGYRLVFVAEEEKISNSNPPLIIGKMAYDQGYITSEQGEFFGFDFATELIPLSLEESVSTESLCSQD